MGWDPACASSNCSTRLIREKVDVRVGVRVDVRVGVRVDVRVGVRVDVGVGVCVGVWGGAWTRAGA